MTTTSSATVKILNIRHFNAPDIHGQKVGTWVDALDCAQNIFPDAVYIGSAYQGLPWSKLSNPYSTKEYGPVKALELYRAYLWSQINAGDQALIDALLGVDERTVFIGWESPRDSHANLIVGAGNWLRSKKAEAEKAKAEAEKAAKAEKAKARRAAKKEAALIVAE